MEIPKFSISLSKTLTKELMFKQAELKKKIKTLGKELALNDNIEQSSRSKICINKTAIKFTKNLQSFP